MYFINDKEFFSIIIIFIIGIYLLFIKSFNINDCKFAIFWDKNLNDKLFLICANWQICDDTLSCIVSNKIMPVWMLM